MRIDDRLLAALGRLAAPIAHLPAWGPRVVVIGLAMPSLMAALLVAATPEPSDISFEDLRGGRIPAMTSWLRLVGDLRVVPRDRSYTFSYPYTYTFNDARGSGLAVTVVADSPLTTGQTDITGRIAGAVSYPGTFASIEADIPTKPGRKDPWLLFSLPAIAAVGLVVGLRAGYPVTRPDPPPRSQPTPLEPGTLVAAQWSGRIEGQLVPLDRMLACTLDVAGGGAVDTRELIVTAGVSTRRLTIRRASPKRRLRVCRISGCLPAVEIHAPSADLVLAFSDHTDRDRLAASLE